MKTKFIPVDGMPSLYIVITGGAGVLVHSMNLFAGSTTTPMSVTANVIANCNFAGGAQSMAFGGYDPQDVAPLDATSTFQLRCVKGTSVSVSMNNGLNPVGAQRRMSDGNNKYMSYQLYTDASRSTIWNTTNTFNYTASNSSPQTISVYGRIPAQQSGVNAGGYTDTVTITATF